MKDFGKNLFGASPCVRWTLSPFLMAFALIIPSIVSAGDPDFMKFAIVYGIEVLVVVMLCGLWAPRKIGRTAFRIACLVVFLGYGVYLTDEIGSGREVSMPRSRAESSLINALFGMIIIGLPALSCAMFGRFASEDRQTAGDDSEDDG